MFKEPDTPRGESYGVLGLGTKMLEAGAERNYTTPTFTNALVSAGYIGSNSYSLIPGGNSSSFGSILFGGVDTTKFEGPLITLETRREEANSTWPAEFVRPEVQVLSMAIFENGTKTVGHARAHGSRALLDSGVAGLILPIPRVRHFDFELPIRRAATLQHGLWLAFCEDDGYANYNFTLTVGEANKDPWTRHNIANITIEIPFHELLQPFYPNPYNESERVTDDSRPLCGLAVSSSEDDDITLGIPFLRSAYTYYNQDEHTVSIAKPAHNTAKHPIRENVVAIGKGPVPKLKGTGHN